jgi:hypothetical protein
MSDSNSDDIGGSDWDSGWFGEGGGGDNADDTNAWWGMGADWNLPDDSAAWGDMGYGWATPGAVWERVDITKDSPEATGYDVFKDAESGKLLTITPSGQYWINDPSTTAKPIKIWDSGALERASPGLGGFINQFAKSIFAKDGKPNVPGILGLTAFLNSGVGKKLLGTGEAPKVGYQGGIPKYEAVRERVSAPYDPNRRPGSGGQRYFSDTKYVDPTKTDELAAAKTAATTQATGLAALNKANPAYEVKPKVEAKKEEPAAAPKGLAALPASAVASTLKVPQYDETGKVVEQERVGPVQDNTQPVKTFGSLKELADASGVKPAEEVVTRNTLPSFGAALPPGYKWGPLDEVIPDSIDTPEQYQEWRKSQGVDVQSTPPPPIASNQPVPIGISQSIPAELVVSAAGGGLMNLAKGRYLNGATDGMADKIPANIEGKQPAALSHGEFVIPADVVSHLGNGNSEAGAKRLYSMMDKIRHARTGTTKQGKQINPNKYLPA